MAKMGRSALSLMIAAWMAAGCASMPTSGSAPVERTGRVLIATTPAQARRIAEYRAPPGATAEAPAWRFDRVPTLSPSDRGSAAARVWIAATPSRSAGATEGRDHPWDVCHRLLDGTVRGPYQDLLSELTRAAGGNFRPLEAEPEVIAKDTRRPPSLDRRKQEADPRSRTLGREVTVCDPPVRHWPRGRELDWHLGDEYSELRSAREWVRRKAPVRDPAQRIKVAIIDTGYNEGHVANPPGLNVEASRDFSVDPFRPRPGAADPYHTGPLKQPGHGCAVVSVLAGNEVAYSPEKFSGFLGGAPDVEVVFLRISDSVIHLSPVSMACAIKYAVAIGCDVISISHGGLPCRMLADAVNEAYENGTAIFAAAGDFYQLPFLGLSTPQKTVYPAAFDRVVSVCGVTADGRTYSRAPSLMTLFTFQNWDHWMLRGSYGPNSVMNEAIAAYTPNVAWARYARHEPANLLDRDGAGTSAATPQVAAAAALWLQAHRDDPALAGKWRSWEKVEAVYWALFDSAQKRTPEGSDTFRYFGNGLLKARRALDLAAPVNLAKRPEARVGLGWLRLWGGLLIGVRDGQGGDELAQARERMLQTELAQLIHGSRRLQRLLDEGQIDARREETPPPVLAAFLRAAAADKNASSTLRKALLDRAREIETRKPDATAAPSSP